VKNLSSLSVVILWAAGVAYAADAQPGSAGPDKVPVGQPTSQEVLKTDIQKLSYFLGMNIANSMKQEGLELDIDVLARAMKDVLAGRRPLLNEEQAQAVATNFQKQRKEQMEHRQKDLGGRNKKDGDAFLAENKKKPGVVTTPSGLQYKVITPGTGAMPKAGDTVTVHYRGTSIDGKEFDSSHKRGQPATFPVGGVIKGWTEALQLMKVGSKWQVVIPPELGYGEQGAGGAIGPNATLVFEVELISIQAPGADQK
jgi:FKBP-type peptidyl-prolyl cis-trans isomerase FklB